MLQKNLGLNSSVLRAFKNSGLDYQTALAVLAWFPSSKQRREMSLWSLKDITQYPIKLFYNPLIAREKSCHLGLQDGTLKRNI